jgi:MFS superfamily sulfate permease-like transporter
MICNELSYGFGIKISAQANTSLYYLINHIFLNSKEIHIYVFFSFTMGTIILSYLLIKQPEVPWHAIFFFVCCALGWSF